MPARITHEDAQAGLYARPRRGAKAVFWVAINPAGFSTESIYGANVSMSGTVLTVRYQSSTSGAAHSYDVMLGRFPTGSYTVNLIVSGVVGATTSFTVGQPMTSSAAPGNVPAVNYTDLWWNPAESGWGLSILQGTGTDNNLFALWFVYDAAGNPTWYSLQPGQWISTDANSIFTGPIYKTSGPYFGGAFDPSKVGVVQVGTGTISFTDSGHAQFSFTVEGQPVTKSIQREPI